MGGYNYVHLNETVLHYIGGTRTPAPPVYAVPDKSKKKRPPETVEHKPDPIQPNVGKSKGFLVMKGKGKKKTLENIELVSQIPPFFRLTLY